MMVLYIDTTSSESTTLELFDDNSSPISHKSWPGFYNQSEELLLEIDKFLQDNNLAKTDLSTVAVNPGPGSFTGVRIGVTTANFLALGLNIPVRGWNKDKNATIPAVSSYRFDGPVMPFYDRPPHITKPKRRLP